MTRERSHPKCPWCEGGGKQLDRYGVPMAWACPWCLGSGEMPATRGGGQVVPPLVTFRDSQTATVIADLTAERDAAKAQAVATSEEWAKARAEAATWKAIALAARPVLEYLSTTSVFYPVADKVLALYPKEATDAE